MGQKKTKAKLEVTEYYTEQLKKYRSILGRQKFIHKLNLLDKENKVVFLGETINRYLDKRERLTSKQALHLYNIFKKEIKCPLIEAFKFEVEPLFLKKKDNILKQYLDSKGRNIFMIIDNINEHNQLNFKNIELLNKSEEAKERLIQIVNFIESIIADVECDIHKSELYFILGKIKNKLGKKDEAKQNYIKVITGSKVARALVEISKIDLVFGNLDESLSNLGEVIQSFDNVDTESYAKFYTAWINMYKREFDKPINTLNKIIKKNAGNELELLTGSNHFIGRCYYEKAVTRPFSERKKLYNQSFIHFNVQLLELLKAQNQSSMFIPPEKFGHCFRHLEKVYRKLGESKKADRCMILSDSYFLYSNPHSQKSDLAHNKLSKAINLLNQNKNLIYARNLSIDAKDTWYQHKYKKAMNQSIEIIIAIDRAINNSNNSIENIILV